MCVQRCHIWSNSGVAQLYRSGSGRVSRTFNTNREVANTSELELIGRPGAFALYPDPSNQSRHTLQAFNTDSQLDGMLP